MVRRASELFADRQGDVERASLDRCQLQALLSAASNRSRSRTGRLLTSARSYIHLTSEIPYPMLFSSRWVTVAATSTWSSTATRIWNSWMWNRKWRLMFSRYTTPSSFTKYIHFQRVTKKSSFGVSPRRSLAANLRASNILFTISGRRIMAYIAITIFIAEFLLRRKCWLYMPD